MGSPFLFSLSSADISLGVRHRVATPSRYRCPLPAGAREGQGEGGLACPCGGDLSSHLRLTAAARPDQPG
jgi:hypothetical protein